MALNIKNQEVEKLAQRLASETGETKTEAIRKSLAERQERLATRGVGGSRKERWVRFLQEEVWPTIPENVRGTTISREEEEAILGLGEDGV